MAPGERGKYQIGGAWLATHTQTQVVPVAHNAGRFWAKNSFIKKPGVIRIHIGKPIQSAGLKADALNSQVEQWIEVRNGDIGHISHESLTLPSGEQLNYQLERRQRRTVGLKITATDLWYMPPNAFHSRCLKA